MAQIFRFYHISCLKFRQRRASQAKLCDICRAVSCLEGATSSSDEIRVSFVASVDVAARVMRCLGAF